MDRIEVNKILKDIEKLDKGSKLYILRKLFYELWGDHPDSPSLSDLKGVGANIWKDENIDEFLESERECD